MTPIRNGRSQRGSSTQNLSPQIIRRELALIRSRSDDKVDELMRAVHKAQDLAFHLKAAEKNKNVCLKKASIGKICSKYGSGGGSKRTFALFQSGDSR